MRASTCLQLALVLVALPGDARAADAVEKRACSFERTGRPPLQSRCVVRTAMLNGIVDATIRMEDGKALHLEGPMGEAGDRYRLQGGMAHRRADEGAGTTCVERDDHGMALCLGQRLD